MGYRLPGIFGETLLYSNWLEVPPFLRRYGRGKEKNGELVTRKSTGSPSLVEGGTVS